MELKKEVQRLMIDYIIETRFEYTYDEYCDFIVECAQDEVKEMLFNLIEDPTQAEIELVNYIIPKETFIEAYLTNNYKKVKTYLNKIKSFRKMK